MVAARLQAGALRRAHGDVAGALDHFRRAAELDEFDESTRVSVIECQVALGNRGAAIAEYQRLRADLKRSLDVEPLPETEQAVQKALGGANAGAARISQPQASQ